MAEGAAEPDARHARRGRLTASDRPIVLLGDVGAGKTTFIQRLVHVDAEEIFQHALNIYIDLGMSTPLGSLQTFVVAEAARQLLVRYDVDIDDAAFVADVYQDELKRLERSPLGRLRLVDPAAYEQELVRHLQRLVDDRPQHLKASLERLRVARRRQIVVFMDNVDQRSDDDQEQVFLIANELAQTWPATVFVTLRPDTFYESSRHGTLAGYQPRVFTIPPPSVDVVLQRRLTFVTTQMRTAGRLDGSLTVFLEIMAENFRANDKLLALINNISDGNTRLALQAVADFLRSGHVDVAKMIRMYRMSASYAISVDEFLPTLLLDAGSLLSILLTDAQLAGKDLREEGCVAADDSVAHEHGFTVDQVRSALDYAEGHHLLDAVLRPHQDQRRLCFRITAMGAYRARVLQAYCAQVSPDQPVTLSPVPLPAKRANGAW